MMFTFFGCVSIVGRRRGVGIESEIISVVVGVPDRFAACGSAPGRSPGGLLLDGLFARLSVFRSRRRPPASGLWRGSRSVINNVRSKVVAGTGLRLVMFTGFLEVERRQRFIEIRVSRHGLRLAGAGWTTRRFRRRTWGARAISSHAESEQPEAEENSRTPARHAQGRSAATIAADDVSSPYRCGDGEAAERRRREALPSTDGNAKGMKTTRFHP